MAATQTDFYKGIFLNVVLSSQDQYKLSILSQGTPSVSGLPLPEWYNDLNTYANEFAAAFTSAIPNSSTIDVTPFIGQLAIDVVFAEPYYTDQYQAFISALSQFGATALSGGYFIDNILDTGFRINLTTAITTTDPFTLGYAIS